MHGAPNPTAGSHITTWVRKSRDSTVTVPVDRQCMYDSLVSTQSCLDLAVITAHRKFRPGSSLRKIKSANGKVRCVKMYLMQGSGSVLVRERKYS